MNEDAISPLDHKSGRHTDAWHDGGATRNHYHPGATSRVNRILRTLFLVIVTVRIVQATLLGIVPGPATAQPGGGIFEDFSIAETRSGRLNASAS